MSDIPETYAQFGLEAGGIMWKQHQNMTRLERENERLRNTMQQAASVADNMGYWFVHEMLINALRGKGE